MMGLFELCNVSTCRHCEDGDANGLEHLDLTPMSDLL